MSSSIMTSLISSCTSKRVLLSRSITINTKIGSFIRTCTYKRDRQCTRIYVHVLLTAHIRYMPNTKWKALRVVSAIVVKQAKQLQCIDGSTKHTVL